jgi:hypothetical protein
MFELALGRLDTNTFQWIWQTTAIGRVVEVVRFMPVDDVHPSICLLSQATRIFTEIAIATAPAAPASLHPRQLVEQRAR